MCRNKPVYKSKRTPFMITLTTQYTIQIQIERFIIGLEKSFTNMIKCEEMVTYSQGQRGVWEVVSYNNQKN